MTSRRQNQDRIVIKEFGNISRICSDLRQGMADVFPSSPSKTKDHAKRLNESSTLSAESTKHRHELILQRTNVNALLGGTLKDVLESRTVWDSIDLQTSTSNHRWVETFLHTLSKCHMVRHLTLRDPSEASLLILALWLQRPTWNPEQSRVTSSFDDTLVASIEHLVLQSSNITNKVGLEIRDGLLSGNQDRLVHLEFSNCSFSTLDAVEAIGTGLQGCQKILRKLSFNNCHLEDYEMAVLIQSLLRQDLPVLVDLDFSVNFCQESGTLALAQLLTTPSLDERNDDNASIEHVPPIQNLDLSCQDVWDDRDYFIHLASALATNETLVELNLSSNFLNDDQFVWLILSLRENRCLTKLNLQDNRISDVGIQAFAKNLRQLHVLEYLDLTRNRYTARSIVPVQEAIMGNSQLRTLLLDWDDDEGAYEGASTEYVLLNYALALNRGGRYCKLSQPSSRPVPLGLWPYILEEGPQEVRDEDELMGIMPCDILYDLLHGPALIER